MKQRRKDKKRKKKWRRGLSTAVGSLLDEQEISQSELAKRADTAQVNVNRLMREEVTLNLGILDQIAEGLGRELVVSFRKPREGQPRRKLVIY